jgi:catechol 2,3-dioxygenase-like lactoylglutathione lyase family enzyme
MFNYCCLGTNDLERAIRFYDAAMGALGYARCALSGEGGWEGWAGWGTYERAALSTGGSCEGPPGSRTHYNPDFYAAYVRDPDGNKLAAVCRGHTAPAIEP